MKSVTICEHCRAMVFAGTHEFRCSICNSTFCSAVCLDDHRCSGLQQLIEPWEEDEADEKFDIVSLLRTMVNPKKLSRSRAGKRAKCSYCHQKRKIVWDDIDFGSLCASCYDGLRAVCLKNGLLEQNLYNLLAKGYRINRLSKVDMNAESFMTLILSRRDLAERHYVCAKIETAKDVWLEEFELYDFKVWTITEITILHIGKKTFEFTPGAYVIVKDK